MARPQKVSDEEIIEAARACILEFGPAVPTATIAERVDVSAQALLKRFGGKDNLVVAALQPVMAQEWETQLPDPQDARALLVQIREVAQLSVAAVPDSICALYAMKWSMVPMSERPSAEVLAPVAFVGALAGWLASLHLRGLIRRVDFHAVALSFFGAIQVRSILKHSLGEASIHGTLAEYLDTIAELYASILTRSQCEEESACAIH